MFGDRSEHVLEYQVQTLALGPQRHVEPGGGRRNGFECRLVQPRSDQLSTLVLDESATLRLRNRDQITGDGSHTDRIDLESTCLCRRSSRLHRAAFQILAIGDQNHDLIAAGPPPQRGLRGLAGA
jgi:hypothetical protein